MIPIFSFIPFPVGGEKKIQIDLAICRELADLDFHSDPADELIAATSIVHNVPLLTRDITIKKSKLVPFA